MGSVCETCSGCFGDVCEKLGCASIFSPWYYLTYFSTFALMVNAVSFVAAKRINAADEEGNPWNSPAAETLHTATIIWTIFYFLWFVISNVVSQICCCISSAEEASPQSLYEKIKNFAQTNNPIEEEKTRTCCDKVTDWFTMIEDIPFPIMLTTFYISELKNTHIEWWMLSSISASSLCWIEKLISVLSRWYDLWFADKLIKYFVDGEMDDGDGETDWEEYLIMFINWAYGWGNVLSNYYFSISSIVKDMLSTKSLMVTAWISFGDASAESFLKLCTDIYNFARGQVRRSKKDIECCVPCCSADCFYVCCGFWGAIVSFGDWVKEIYRQCIEIDWDKYISLLNEIPQLVITWYHLAAHNYKNFPALVSAMYSLTIIIFKFFFYWLVDTYVKENVDQLKGVQKTYKKLILNSYKFKVKYFLF